MAGRARTVAWIVGALSVAGIVAGTWAMVGRVAEFNRRSTKELYVFQQIGDRDFAYSGRQVHITDTTDEHGNAGVLIAYGDDTLPLRATIPPGDPALPGLARHIDWLTALRFAPRRGLSLQELERRIDAGEVEDRLVVVVREPQPGSNPMTFGRAVQSDWLFHLYEFKPGGGFSIEHLHYPESDTSLARRRAAARLAGRPEPGPREDDLKEGTWEFGAALLAMPEGSAPGPTFAGDAMSATGWTLPVTGVSVMGLVGAAIALVITRGAAPNVKSDQRD